MDQSTELNINQNQSSDSGLSPRKRDAFDTVANWLALLILILAALLLKDVVLKRVDTPRTAIERDIINYTELLRKDPKNAGAHAGLGVAYMNMGSFSPAAGEFARAAELDPAKAQYHFNLGVANVRLGKDTVALKQLNLAGKLMPKWEAPFYEAGRVYGKLKEYDKAIASLETSLRLVAGNADAHYELGRAYERKGDRDQAAGHFREVLKYVPDDQRAVKALEGLRGR